MLCVCDTFTSSVTFNVRKERRYCTALINRVSCQQMTSDSYTLATPISSMVTVAVVVVGTIAWQI